MVANTAISLRWGETEAVSDLRATTNTTPNPPSPTAVLGSSWNLIAPRELSDEELLKMEMAEWDAASDEIDLDA